MVQLTKLIITVVSIIDFRDSLDHGVERIGDEGAATKLIITVVAIIDFRDSLDHGVESIGDDGAAHKDGEEEDETRGTDLLEILQLKA